MARVRRKMADAVALAKLHGVVPVERALATAADLGRFGEDDLVQLLRHQATARPGPLQRVTEGGSLQRGTAAWAGFGARMAR